MNIANECRACHKTYSTVYNLQKHLKRQPLCEKWVEMKPGIKDYVDDKFRLPMNDLDQKEIANKCFICNTTFANNGNLNRHLDTNIVCSKWSMYKEFEPLTTYINGKSHLSFIDGIDGAGCNNVFNSEYEEFVTPAYSLCHIIWNVFLMDKEFATLDNFKDIVEENNIKYVIALLPNKQVYNEKIKIDIDHHIITYTGHDMDLTEDMIKEFDEQCIKIEEYKSHADGRANIFIFCNNGYQRSIPFLCYYLLKYHKNEAPTIEKALDLVLPQVDKQNYATIRAGYIEQITTLFDTNNLNI